MYIHRQIYSAFRRINSAHNDTAKPVDPADVHVSAHHCLATAAESAKDRYLNILHTSILAGQIVS
jgi:hypothetical protein